MAIFPSSLTEDEEALQKKYAKLKKKVKTTVFLFSMYAHPNFLLEIKICIEILLLRLRNASVFI